MTAIMTARIFTILVFSYSTQLTYRYGLAD